MNDGHLLVNFNALDQARMEIAKAVNKLTADLEYLEGEGKKLLGTWSGTAQQSYEARQKQWQAASQDLQIILTEIGSALERSKDDYHDTERAAAQRFQ
ncbi:WXG100 family type VII secretion target [Actinoplanes sp. NPDC023801]|uniref:WXG100 family type VII secretion target n=1 Tax=Actinoplanes sp. NPDC023801 TaxID=3154595 RepID=UPI0033FCCF6E